MSILLNGLSMPKGGFESLDLSIDSDGKVYIDERDWFGRHTYKLAGEAIPLPDHGDLIDRDAFMKHKGSAYDIDGHELYAVGTGTILRMPVVIPAERSKE